MLTACLPLQPQGEANIPLAVRSDDPHEVRCRHVLRSRLPRSRAQNAGAPEVRSIRQVIELRPELQLRSFCNREISRNTEIGVPQTGVSHDIAPRGSEPLLIDSSERCRSIVVATRTHSAQELYSGNLISRLLVARTGIQRSPRGRNREWRSGIRRMYAAQLPTADDL